MTGQTAQKKMSNDEFWETVFEIPNIWESDLYYTEPGYKGGGSIGGVAWDSKYSVENRGNPDYEDTNWNVKLNYENGSLKLKATTWELHPVYSYPRRTKLMGEISIEEGMPEVTEFLEGRDWR